MRLIPIDQDFQIMRSVLSTIHWIIRYSGAAYLIRRVFARNNITIVMYHNPGEDDFRNHLKYLSGKYQFITLSELIDFFYTDVPVALPEYPFLITIDDGWKENYRLLDIFREFKVRPVIFLSSHLVDTDRNFWFTACSQSEVESLKKKPSDQRLLALKTEFDFYPEKEFPGNRQVLNMDEICKMKEYVDFGSHTCFHTILPKCDLHGKISEINGSVDRLNELLEQPLTSFAFPNGDYEDESIELLKKCNIKIGRTIDAGWNNRKSNPYKLKVTGVSDDASITRLASELTGISMFMQYLLKGSFNGLKPKI
jgi:poly-beta-1,6-N-acetyl-D-glucosamine N-deacetylase